MRKKLKWPYNPFNVPENILNEWKKIGIRGSKIETKWNKIYKIKKIK